MPNDPFCDPGWAWLQPAFRDIPSDSFAMTGLNLRPQLRLGGGQSYHPIDSRGQEGPHQHVWAEVIRPWSGHLSCVPQSFDGGQEPPTGRVWG